MVTIEALIQDIFNSGTNYIMYAQFSYIILSIIPFLINFNYYRKTRIKDYLFISIYFFVWSFGLIIYKLYWGYATNLFQFDGIIGQYALVDLIYGQLLHYVFTLMENGFPLLIVALRAKYGTSFKNIPKGFLALALYPLIMFVIDISFQTTFNVIFYEAFPGWGALNLFSLQTSRVILHLLVVYVFLSTKFERTSRTVKSHLLWITSSLLFALSMGWGFIFSFVFVDLQQILGLELLSFSFEFLLQISFTLILINHIFFPESVLFTHEHIGIAMKAYDKLKLSCEVSPDRGINRIKSYLDSLPGELRSSLGLED